MIQSNKEKQSSTSSKKPFDQYVLLIIGLPLVFWAFAFPLIKVGLTELSPENLAILRLFIASMIFFVFFLLKRKKLSPLHKKDILPLFLIGFTGISVYHLGLNYGEQFISAGVASLIIATIPIYVVILACVFLKEQINKFIISGILVALLGVIIISLWGNPNTIIEINYIFGALAVILAAFVGAVYTIAGKKMLQHYTPFSLTTYVFILGNLGLIFFVRPSLFYQVSNLSVETWAAVLFLACCPTVIAYFFWYSALRIKPASELSVYLYFTPMLTTLLGFFFFNESITPWYILGGGLVITGLYIVNQQQKKSNKKLSIEKVQ